MLTICNEVSYDIYFSKISSINFYIFVHEKLCNMQNLCNSLF